MSAQRWLLGFLGVSALAGGAALLAARLFAPKAPDAAPTTSNELDELPPDSTVFEPAPLSESDLTVRLRERGPRWSSADDWESLASNELGAAYLSRATEQGELEEDSLEDELLGFQIIER